VYLFVLEWKSVLTFLVLFVCFQGDIVKELGKARLEIDNVKRQMLQQEIAFNIQQTDALTRLVIPVHDKDVECVHWVSHWSLKFSCFWCNCYCTSNSVIIIIIIVTISS
jgi:hypothetical protein